MRRAEIIPCKCLDPFVAETFPVVRNGGDYFVQSLFQRGVKGPVL